MPIATPLFRFVQVRQAVRPVKDDVPPGNREPLDALGDFRDDLKPEAAEALTAGQRARILALAQQTVESLKQRDAALRRRLKELLRRVSANADLTLGELRELGKGSGTPGAPTDKALSPLVKDAVTIVVLCRALGRTEVAAARNALRLLRGVVVQRLLDTRLPDAAVAAPLLERIALQLPKARQPAPRDRDELNALRRSAERVSVRARALGLSTAMSLADLSKANVGNLKDELEQVRNAASRRGLPETATIEGAIDLFNTEYWSEARDPFLSADELDDWLDWLPTTDPSLPTLDGRVRVLGRGDLMLVRIEHDRYEMGEIAFVENVMQSEQRTRNHVIDTATSERIIETQNLFSESSQELTTTERTDLQRAAETVNTTATSLSAGMSIAGGFGPVSVGLDLNASRSTTTSESNSSASSYARDVTDKASETMRTEASTRTVTSRRTRVTETNGHTFDARDATGHIRGVYRWLERVDRAQLYNYGERLLVECVVPEPALQHVLLNANAATASAGALPAPLPLDFGPEDVTDLTYRDLGLRYGVIGLEPPPQVLVAASTTVVIAAAKAFEYPQPKDDKDPDPEATQPLYGHSVAADELALPAGYVPVSAKVTLVRGGTEERAAVTVSVGGVTCTAFDTGDERSLDLTAIAPGPIAVVVGSLQSNGIAVSVRVEGRRTGGARESWQLRTFELIQSAYQSLQAAYDAQQSAASVRQSYAAVTPSAVNRSIELRELKRCCQTLLTGQDFSLFGSVNVPAPGAAEPLPEIDLDEAWREADIIQFIEDAFEYDLSAYVFYPYQWAGRHRWAELALRTSSDPLHEAFLQAGAARVVIPVREGYERRVARFLRSGDVPVWGPAPWRGEPTKNAAVDELIADANDRPGAEVAIGEPWEVVTPTTLVYLQEDAALDVP